MVFSIEKPKRWKWFHTDLMTKEWFRDFGHTLEFDFLYSYEYDLLTLKALDEIYPNIDANMLALAAVTKLKDVEWSWDWTGRPEHRPNWLEFKEYMQKMYGLEEQKFVCLGPGPLLPRVFLEKFAAAEDIEWVHEEITLPAYAEVFGLSLVDHGMHPGFGLTPDEKYFSCRKHHYVEDKDIAEQMKNSAGRRTFHPVKHMISLAQVNTMIEVT